MEDLKEKLPIIIIVILAILICGLAYYFLWVKEVVYYTKIDNTKIEELNNISDEMKYQYTLDCYNENGKKKEIQFKTSRELREDAYLILEVINVSGVHSWKEVGFDELPSKVQEQYSK